MLVLLKGFNPKDIAVSIVYYQHTGVIMVNREWLESEFKKSMNACFGIVCAKNRDYAGEGDPFRNFKSIEVNGITSVETGFLVRMQDKWSRIITLINNDGKANVKEEKLEDTLNDFINYLTLLKLYRKSKRA